MCFNMVKNGKIQLKLGNLLMSAKVFTFLTVQHLFFEGKKKMVKHLIIKIRRIYFKICLKTSACFMIFNILSTAF